MECIEFVDCSYKVRIYLLKSTGDLICMRTAVFLKARVITHTVFTKNTACKIENQVAGRLRNRSSYVQ